VVGISNGSEICYRNLINEDADAIVNTVNCVGVMGKGIALQFKNAFPKNYALYASACKRGELRPGRMFVFKTEGLANPKKYIINFPTKEHWKGKSRLRDLDSGLTALADEVQRLEIRSIAIPALGCGNGGLDWDVVRPRIEQTFKTLPNVEVRLYAPSGAPAPEAQPIRTERPRLTRVRAALVKAC
jgi:O-acetyl-ADP-ribose deacetylase (regulator of RNase III)